MNKKSLPKIISYSIVFLAVYGIFHLNTICYAKEDLLRVHFIDVGYGDAILLEFPDGTNFMMDAGGRSQAPDLIHYLKKRGIQRIDTAMITHPHENHFGGFFGLAAVFPIERLFINGEEKGYSGYDALLKRFQKKHIPVQTLKRGQRIGSLPDGVQIEILHPQALTSSPNGNSIVSLLTYKNISILFMADVEPAQQDEIIRTFKKIKNVDYVKVPHHGGPLSREFFEAFVGKTFVISTGPNRWGIPLEEDLQRLLGTVLRTDQSGTIVIESDGEIEAGL